jgi:hypothetical protein
MGIEFENRKDQMFMNKNQQTQDDGLNALKKFLINRIDAFPDENRNKLQLHYHSNNPTNNPEILSYSNSYKRILNKLSNSKYSIPTRTRLKSARPMPTSPQSDCQSSLRIISKNISKLNEEQRQQAKADAIQNNLLSTLNIPKITYMANLTAISSIPRFKSPHQEFENPKQTPQSERPMYIEINRGKGINSSLYKTHKDNILGIGKPKIAKKVGFSCIMYY